jgi:hypothetical protein
METAGTKNAWKILILVLVCLTGLFIFLVALASSETDDSKETPGLSSPEKPGLSSPKQSGGPAKFLEDFEFVPGSAVLVDQRHILALFKNPQKDFYAVVLFNADCDRTGCTPNELIAFSIVDSEGRDVELANELGVKSPRAGQDI